MRLAPNRGAAADGLYVLSYGMEACCAVTGDVESRDEGRSLQRGAGGRAVRSVERASRILRVLGDNGHQGVADLAAAIGLSRGTVHGLLQSLVGAGMVRQDADTGRYALGPVVAYLGSCYLRDDEVRVCAARWSRSLAEETSSGVQVGRLYGLEVLIVNRVDRSGDCGYLPGPGSLCPAHTSALGKVLLAHRGVPADMCVLTDARPAPTSLDGVERELRQVLKQGWAAAGGATEAMEASIACPIVSRSGQIVAAIAAVGRSDQLLDGERPRAKPLERVRSAAVGISRDLGAKGW